MRKSITGVGSDKVFAEIKIFQQEHEERVQCSAYLSVSIACIMCFHYVMLWNVSRLFATIS